ncbi:tRNA 2-selenouridine(34) synthase MnmH [Salipaludibacillus sp. CF4.18]|uniref:tRNA 2-selenouridine(34) synthase MnmH n=1 Tax=Salipaludibacillus sp. CF4.18 TaxID=3373081 RepID=UPI003EE55A3E
MSERMLPTIQYHELLEHPHYLIDVRSPAEFEEFHEPGSINVPLFTNDERAQIGTLYKQESPEKAKEIGVNIYSKKLPEFYAKWMKFNEKYAPKTAVVACARGGMRSASFVSVMHAMDIPVLQLEGGVRSIRKHVQERLESLSQMDWKTIVLEGNTGTGKTKWLEELKQRGYPVIDLEGLANHRGSVFGQIGKTFRSQKQFEFLLAKELSKISPGKTMILEAESKRIGRIVLPDFIMETKENGHYIEIHDGLDRRVDRLLEDYQPHEYVEEFKHASAIIRKGLPTVFQKEMDDLLKQEDFKQLSKLLLTEYYDKKYGHKRATNESDFVKRELLLHDLSEEEIIDTVEEEVNHLMVT